MVVFNRQTTDIVPLSILIEDFKHISQTEINYRFNAKKKVLTCGSGTCGMV